MDRPDISEGRNNPSNIEEASNLDSNTAARPWIV